MQHLTGEGSTHPQHAQDTLFPIHLVAIHSDVAGAHGATSPVRINSHQHYIPVRASKRLTVNICTGLTPHRHNLLLHAAVGLIQKACEYSLPYR